MNSTRTIDPEDLALYAMQLLPQDEMETMTQQLTADPAARQELAEIRGTLAGFAYATEMEAAPALARTKFLKQVERERQTTSLPEAVIAPTRASAVSSIGAYQRGVERGDGESKFDGRETVAAAKPRGVLLQMLPWAGWAVAAGLALTAGNLYREREGLRGTIATDQNLLAKTSADAATAHDVLNAMNDQTAMRVTLTRQGALPTPTGRTTYSADKGVLIFTATNLEPIDTFKVYELWLIPTNGSGPMPAGTFRPDAHGYANLISTTMPKGVEAKAFGITIEADGGAKTPTPPILMTGA